MRMNGTLKTSCKLTRMQELVNENEWFFENKL